MMQDMPFGMNMDFGALDGNDVLDGFDFDSFLQIDGDQAPNFDFDGTQFPPVNGEGVEGEA